MAYSALESLNLVAVSKPVDVIFSLKAVSGKFVLAGSARLRRLASEPVLFRCL